MADSLRIQPGDPGQSANPNVPVEDGPPCNVNIQSFVSTGEGAVSPPTEFPMSSAEATGVKPSANVEADDVQIVSLKPVSGRSACHRTRASSAIEVAIEEKQDLLNNGQVNLMDVKQEPFEGDAPAMEVAAAVQADASARSPAPCAAKQEPLEETPDKATLAASQRKRRLLKKTSVDEVKKELASAMSAGEALQKPVDLLKDEDVEMKYEDMKDEQVRQVEDELNDEIKLEVKMEEDDVIELEEAPDVNMEDMKDEPYKVTPEVKDEDEKIKTEEAKVKKEGKLQKKAKMEGTAKNYVHFEGKSGRIKLEPIVKSQRAVKRELESLGQDSATGSPFKRRRISVKREPVEFESSSSTTSSSAISKAADTFDGKVPGWIQECIRFQKSNKTWSPAKPCCPANCFLSESTAPPKLEDSQPMLSCFDRLSKPQRHKFRTFFEHNPDDSLFDNKTAGCPKLFLAPERQSVSSEEERKYRSADCMKMWPWMRDLPSRIWAGRGWASTEDGMKKLPVSGGCDAIAGMQHWESTGAGQSESDMKVLLSSEVSSGEDYGVSKKFGVQTIGRVPAAKNPAGQGRGPRRQSKQSGIDGVRWHAVIHGWQLRWIDLKDGKRKQMAFPLKRYTAPNRKEEEASDKALSAARRAKDDLIKRGLAKKESGGKRPVQNPKAASARITRSEYCPEVTGAQLVGYPNKIKYRCRVRGERNGKQVLLASKYIKPKDQSRKEILKAKAIAEATQVAWNKEWGRDQVTQVKDSSQLKNRKSTVRGIMWNHSEQRWHIILMVAGFKVNRRFEPEDDSDEASSKAFEEAKVFLEALTKAKAEIEKEPDKTKATAMAKERFSMRKSKI